MQDNARDGGSTKAVDRAFFEVVPHRVIFDLVRAWALILASVSVAISVPKLWVWLALVPVIGTQMYALQILNHDGLHRSITRNRLLNDLICRVLLSYPLFTAFEGFRKKHLQHHRSLGQPEDPDRYYHVTSDKATRGAYLLFLLGVGSALRGLASGAKGGKAEKSAEPKRDWILMGLTQVAIAAVLTYFGGWAAYPVLWVIPFGVFVYILQSWRSFSEHACAEPDSTADQHRLITYTSNRLERVFFAPCNMNYHAEHHLYPQVPYYHLPKLRQTLRDRGDLSSVEFRGSYLGFMRRYFQSLPII